MCGEARLAELLDRGARFNVEAAVLRGEVVARSHACREPIIPSKRVATEYRVIAVARPGVHTYLCSLQSGVAIFTGGHVPCLWSPSSLRPRDGGLDLCLRWLLSVGCRRSPSDLLIETKSVE